MEPEEVLLAWRARCRDLFVRAYPGENAEASPHAIKRFIDGISSRIVRMHVREQNPNTMNAALQAAENKQASMIAEYGGNGNGKKDPAASTGAAATHALGRGNPWDLMALAMGVAGDGPTCFFCEEKGHKEPECPAYLKYQQRKSSFHARRNGKARRGPPPAGN